MPPPHFSTTIGGSSQQATQQQQQTSSTASISDLPKQIRQHVKEALFNIQTALTIEDETELQTASLKSFQSIQKLVNSADLLQQDKDGESGKGSGVPRSRVLSGGEGPSSSISNAGETAQGQVARHVSIVVNTSLFNLFSDEMDQDSHTRRQLLIGFLHALRPILDPRCVVMEWWDVLLRPMLKNPHCNVSVSRKAQSLVIWAMAATPSSAYVDEPAPSAAWPPPDTNSAITSWRNERRQGDAPYPASSTRSISHSRSSEDGEARFSALFSTPAKKAGPSDPLRRFTQRIFDLYTSEASSASTKSMEEDEAREIKDDGDEEDDQDEEDEGEHETQQGATRKDSRQSSFSNGATSADLDMVGPTWKGNLEAIILTFGEERPKPFFHHLSESYIDPHARIPILLLLTIFFRLSSLYAYHVVATPFVRLLVLSLQLDTSKTSTSLGILALVTLVPHFPNWLANGGAGGLPALLSILARIIDWRKVNTGWEERSNTLGAGKESENKEVPEQEKVSHHLSKRLQLRKGLEWKRLESTYDNSFTQRPDAEMLFTVLYGIFPCNLIRFLRAPIDYLRKAEYQSPFQTDWEDIIDENAVQNKAAPIIRRHLLHPALVDMTAEQEISDTQRWNDHDTASTTAFCASLCIGGNEVSMESSYSPHSELEGIPLQVRSMSGSSFHADTSSAMSESYFHPIRAKDLNTELDGRNQAPLRRFHRQRSASENLGRQSRSSIVQASLYAKETLSPPLVRAKRREASVHFIPIQGGDSSTSTSPRLPSTWERKRQNDYLRNHVALRSTDLSLSPASRNESIGDHRNRSFSSQSSSPSGALLRSFQPAQPTLASVLMSPSRSSNLSFPPSTASDPATPTNEIVGGRNRSESLSSITSPLDKGERTLLGSPAISIGPPIPNTVKRTKLAYLKQENLQLRNELNYEIGQKDQLLQYIGTIHRNRVKDTVLEEELQNLYQSARSDKIQLKSLKDELEVTKAEARQSKTRQINWQADLTAKLKAIREEKKAWGNEVRQLKIAKEDQENLIEKLERQVEENASELFELREKVKADTDKVKAIQRYEEKIERLESSLRFWNDDMKVFEKQNGDMRRLLSKWEELTMLVEASEGEAESMRKRMELMQEEKEALQRNVKEARSVIDQLAKKQTVEALERVKVPHRAHPSSPSLPTAREDGEKARMKRRLEELEAQLLDARVREEQLQHQLSRSEGHDRDEVEVMNSPSPADHDITLLDLGESVGKD